MESILYNMRPQYEELPSAELDQIMLANAEWPEFKKLYDDPINTTIGVLIDPDTNNPWRPASVIEAREEAANYIDQFAIFGYQAPAGHKGFLRNAESFVFGFNNSGADIMSYQSLGGTGALTLTKDILSMLMRSDNVLQRQLVLDPGWPNHPANFQEEFNITTYPHVDPETGSYQHAESLEAIRSVAGGSAVLFQVSGYNDDGVDRTPEEWDEVLDLAKEKELVVILDAAYIGLTGTVAEDTYPIQQALQKELFSFVNVSMSKNMGIYNERLGALFIANAKGRLGDSQAQNLDQAVKKQIRRTVSNPPLLVAEAASETLAVSNPDNNYYVELLDAKKRLKTNRESFAEIIGEDIPIVKKGRGLFTKLIANGFSEGQLQSIRQEGILALPNSRINIGGMRPDQIERVGEAVVKALKGD